MNITGFTDPEKQALMELLLLGMYSDGHLATTEDERVKKLLESMAFTSEHARKQFADSSITKLRERNATAESTRGYLIAIAKEFSTTDTRARAVSALEDLLRSDNRVTDREREFLTAVNEIFQG